MSTPWLSGDAIVHDLGASLGAAVPMTDVMAAGPATDVAEWNAPGDENPVRRWTTRDTTLYNCAYEWKAAPVNEGMLIVQALPGAEWIWSQLESSAGVTSTPLTVPGRTGAAYRFDT